MEAKHAIFTGNGGQIVLHGTHNGGYPRLRLSFISDAMQPTAGWVSMDAETAKELFDALKDCLTAMHTEGA